MKNPCIYAGNFVRKVLWKIRFGERLSMGNIQTFAHVKLEIRNHGRIRIGNFNQNRGLLYLIADQGKISIGDHCFFNSNSSITSLESVAIGNNCKFGNNLVIVDHDHNFKRMNNDDPEFISAPVSIGNNVWVGANVVILRGTNIGDNCVIAAGSIVKGDIATGSRYIQKRENLV